MKKSFGNSYFEIGIYLLFGACVLEFNPSAEVKSSKHHVVKSEIPLAKGAGGFERLLRSYLPRKLATLCFQKQGQSVSCSKTKLLIREGGTTVANSPSERRNVLSFQSSSDSKSGADFYRATGESSEGPFCKTGNLRLLIYF